MVCLQQRHPSGGKQQSGFSADPGKENHPGKHSRLTFYAGDLGDDFWVLSTRAPPQEAGREQQSEQKVSQPHVSRFRLPSSWIQGNKQGRKTQQLSEATIWRQESLKIFFLLLSSWFPWVEEKAGG